MLTLFYFIFFNTVWVAWLLSWKRYVFVKKIFESTLTFWLKPNYPPFCHCDTVPRLWLSLRLNADMSQILSDGVTEAHGHCRKQKHLFCHYRRHQRHWKQQGTRDSRWQRAPGAPPRTEHSTSEFTVKSWPQVLSSVTHTMLLTGGHPGDSVSSEEGFCAFPLTHALSPPIKSRGPSPHLDIYTTVSRRELKGWQK